MNPNDAVRNKIIDLWNSNRGKSFDSFIKLNPDVDEYLTGLVESDSWFENRRRAFVCVANGIYERKVCCVCGMTIDVRKACKGRKYCSSSCSATASNAVREMTKEEISASNAKRCHTNMEKYGVSYPMCSEEVKGRYRSTCLEKYGVENAMQSDVVQERRVSSCMERNGVGSHFKLAIIQDKIKMTNLERYGVEHSAGADCVKMKIKGTLSAHYGVDNPFKSQQIRERIKQTCIERYGSENAMCSEIIQEKLKGICLERYGTEHSISSSEVHEKCRKTIMERYGSKTYNESRQFYDNHYDRIQLWSNYVVPLFDKSEYSGWSKTYKWKCVKCGNEFEQRIYSTQVDCHDGYIPRCLNCYPHLVNTSHLEKDVLDYIKSICEGVGILENARGILSGKKELDIYIPEKNIAIEFDGLYWHSEAQGKDEFYHLDKTEECEKLGIHLIHIFEDEWVNRQAIVKDRIRSILGIGQKRIHARKCILKEVNSKECSEFLDANHLQGADKSKIRYGLFYNDELVAVMTFGKPRFNRNYDWELVRYSSKSGYNVVGGASKLLSHFMKNNAGTIISYADRRYSAGNLYEKLGFVKKGITSPNYWYVKGLEKLSRYQCQKHKLAKLLGDGFDANLTESENMLLNGWSKIFDSGNLVYVIGISCSGI